MKLCEPCKKELDSPGIDDFFEQVKKEAAYQRARWSANSHDAAKSDADWFWLIGYLAGKAMHNPGHNQEKRLHRIITVAAAACNWFQAAQGKSKMRPGMDPAKMPK